MKKQIIQSFLAMCLITLSHGVWADSFILKDVQVIGLQRIAASTVLSNVPVSVGEEFDDSQTAGMVKSLFKTGFFDDVKVTRRENVLLITVVERAAVGDVTVTGNKALQTPDLIEALKRVGIAKGRPLDRSALKQIEQEITQQYIANGNYSVDVKTKIEKLTRNRVALKIEVEEGDVAQIQRVNISGNKAFKEEILSDLLASGPKGKFSFFSTRDKYAREKLVGDLDKLTSFYQDRGYLNFEVVSTQVSLSKDKRLVVLNINIKEGDQYRVGKVDILGNTGLPKNDLAKLITLKKGQVFSQTKLSQMRNDINKRLGQEGFAYSRVGVTPVVDDINKRVNINFKADKGQRTYVRRINIRGNFRTKDEVFRRQIRQLESSFLSNDKVKRSETNIRRLPFVSNVKINTLPVAGQSDQVDLDVIVSEESSNQFSAGVGVSQSNGLLFNLGLTQNNFVGTGKNLSLNGQRSESTNTARISFNDPFHTVDGIGRGFSLFFEDNDAEEDDISDFRSNTFGGDINYTIPLTEDNSLRFSLGVEQREIITTDNTPDDIQQFVDDNGEDYFNFIGTLSYIHDTRNRSLFPTDGARQEIRLELSLPGSDLEYYKLDYNTATYFPFADKVSLVLRTRIATGDSYGDVDELPFFERFFSGGISSVRGFDNNSLGPRDSNDDSSGGDFVVNATAELQFPAPFAKDVAGLRLSAFIDAGQVYDNIDTFEADDVRFSAGLSLSWVSPVGPLTISYGQPLNSEDGDEEERIQFTIGTSF